MERFAAGRGPGRARPILSATSLRWWSGVFCTLLGAFMVVVPGQFETTVYEALQRQIAPFGLLFFSGGWAMLTVAALRPRQWLHAGAHVVVIGAFLLFAGSFAEDGIWSGTVVYGVLAAVLVVSALLPARQTTLPGVRRGDLLALGLGLGNALSGLVMLLVSPANAAITRELRLPLGGLILVAGSLLAAVQLAPNVSRRWSVAVHLGAGVAFLGAATLLALPRQAWSGVALNGSGGALVALLPWLRHRLRHFDPASLATRLSLLLVGAASLPLVLTVGRLHGGRLGLEAGARLSAFVVLIGIVALAFVLGIGGARYLARPLRRLGEAADRLAAGEPAVPLERFGISEIDRLSANFGHMRDRLLDRTQRAEELAAELRRRADELAESDRRKDEFVAMLAHELRNPLGAVSSAVHLLEECGERDETATRAAAVARRQMRRLSRLVDDLLDVSRITRGQVPLHLAAVDLVEVLRLSVEDARAQFEQAGVELAVTLPVGGLPLEADATRLEQVFGNLLGNAAKYGQPGGSASLAVRRDGGVAVVRIADDGAGIESDALPRVFDLFFQGAPSLDRHDGGLGIGLTLVRKLVELHGGEVTAASDGTGHGSEFTVRLPLAG